MANIYISYKQEDSPIVRELSIILKGKNHNVRSDLELFTGSSWRRQLFEALISSDVVIIIWSKNTYLSPYVASEAGAARAVNSIGILPVLIGDVQIPTFLGDLQADRIPNTEMETLIELGNRLDEAICKFLEFKKIPKAGRPKLFISHRHKDEDLVSALIDCIKTYFNIQKEDIRCTSVRPYRLPVGENTADRLRDEIKDAEVVLGILTKDTLSSSYVAFELGSAWGQKVWTCPLLARGADQSHIPDPIKNLSPLFLTNNRECLQFLSDLEGFTTLKKRTDADNEELADKIHRLVEIAKKETAE